MPELQGTLEKLSDEPSLAGSSVSERPLSEGDRPWQGERSRNNGWVSPNYTHSRQVTLNEELVVENRCVALRSELPEVDYYRVLRTQILQLTQKSGGNTIMITSPLPGEGKTLTAVNLALTFARDFKKTALLVDCDLRKQQVQEFLGFRSSRGLVDYLLYDCPVSDLMIWPGIEKLTVISGGRTMEESTELLGSPRMQALVTEMKTRYPDRYVFFDVPAVLDGADALAFAPLVDHILLTVRAGSTPQAEIRKAAALLPREKILGLVLNREDKGKKKKSRINSGK
jgi:non-specific protein-tyrosine kinase